MIIFEDNKGFVMDYDLSGPELKYTMKPSEAEVFDTQQQAKYAIKVNNLPVDKTSLLRYNNA